MKQYNRDDLSNDDVDINLLLNNERELQTTAISETNLSLGLLEATLPNFNALEMEQIISRDFQLIDPEEHERLLDSLICLTYKPS